MWDSDISTDIIIETLIDDYEMLVKRPEIPPFARTMQELRGRFPGATEKELTDIISLVCAAWLHNPGDKCELVITAPPSFRLKAKKTQEVVTSLISNANRSIMMTGYAISDYIDNILDCLIRKSLTGVYIDLYVNDMKKNREQLQRLRAHTGQYLRLYEYSKVRGDEMAALHAKLIVADGQLSFVSSANLSYHGMQGNIEMGVLIDSTDKAKEIESLLRELRRMEVFLPVAGSDGAGG